jgi:hypothetical protein
MKKKTSRDFQLEMVKSKFIRLKKLQAQISEVKTLYAQHDEIMNDLLPLFVTVRHDTISIRRELKIGTKTYRLNPHFYDTKKGRIVSSVWKSTACKTATIE